MNPGAAVSKFALIVNVSDGNPQYAARVVKIAQRLSNVQVIAAASRLTREDSQRWSQAQMDCTNLQVRDVGEDLGKGAALRSALNQTRASFVAFLDLDGDVDPRNIEEIFRKIESENEVDGIIGCRWGIGARSSASLQRTLTSRAFAFFARAVLSLKVHDPQSPLKVFRRSALLTVFERLRLYNHGFDAELVFHAQRAGLRLKEVALDWSARPHTWRPVPVGLRTALSLLAARLLNSWVSKVPFVDLLGRRYSIPVKRSYSILMYCWRDPKNPLAGGGEAYLYEQAKCWAAAGHKVTWFAQSYTGSVQAETVDGVRFVRWGRFPFVFLLGAIWYVFRSDRQFDFIIDCMNGIPFFTPLFSTKPKVCLVYHVHSHHFRTELPPVIGSIAAFVETKVVPVIYRNTRFLTISDSTKSEMEALHFSRHPISLVHSGVSSALHPGVKATRPTIVHLGRLKKYKRVRTLIDAFCEIKKDLPDAALLIAGTGDDEAPLREYVAAKGIDGVQFCGRVSEAKKAQLLQGAWVFGMPSSIEGWGIVVIEANACATPAVAFDVGGLRDCIVNGKTGLLAKSEAEFTSSLRRVLTDENLRRLLSEEAATWAHQFTWDAAAQRTLSLIRQMQPWRAVFEPDMAVPGSWLLKIAENARR